MAEYYQNTKYTPICIKVKTAFDCSEDKKLES